MIPESIPGLATYDPDIADANERMASCQKGTKNAAVKAERLLRQFRTIAPHIFNGGISRSPMDFVRTELSRLDEFEKIDRFEAAMGNNNRCSFRVSFMQHYMRLSYRYPEPSEEVPLAGLPLPSAHLQQSLPIIERRFDQFSTESAPDSSIEFDIFTISRFRLAISTIASKETLLAFFDISIDATTLCSASVIDIYRDLNKDVCFRKV
uniref:Uncharacterized protein n=1 Tax=Vespula pensylvanica TaxID=30213 RepID=A0A834P1E1_VESPE|nr:hypothetical protein H0235_007483 [Vespula pensylvanica]